MTPDPTIAHHLTAEELFHIIFTVIGGLGIFILGMHNLSNGLHSIAGKKLKHLISTATNNRYFGAIIGTVVTTIIQSSSITTVMVVGFVSSSLMTLSQGIRVIMGANIGTTMTGWILVVKIGKYGLPILGISGLISIFSKNDKLKYISTAIMGLGMVFYGMELMKNGFKPIREIEEFRQLFQMFSATTYWGMWKCILTGATLTMIVQSSSATLGITMGLATTGVIQFETAAALVLGENIGTTVTAYLASLGANIEAKRTSYAHIFFNILGVLWISSVFPVYLVLVKKFIGFDPNTAVFLNGEYTFPHITKAIASVHSGFNVVNTLIMLPFAHILAKYLEKFITEKDAVTHPRLTHLDPKILDDNSPNLGNNIIHETQKEILIMSDMIIIMFKYTKEVVQQKELADFDIREQIIQREELLDIHQKEVTDFLSQAFSSKISMNYAMDIKRNMRTAYELESISDYMVNILKLSCKAQENDYHFSTERIEEIAGFHDKIFDYYLNVIEMAKAGNHTEYPKISGINDQITNAFRKLEKKHINLVCNQEIDSTLNIIYLDIINEYRQIQGHIYNIAEEYATEA